ncbi:MAG: hypothetical protein OEL56_03720 [Nitrosopumilus sp.]|nr:hypothetical protein [Nitrosopumilus sp.]MDH3489535.1 hypothetical protein [Nitrosopumilus sp.]MDH3516533.1 hypothetical protein [Nitrosopumilus sp.]MDH3564999.1 hypothetical protein [Nitrosopumilus sp.]MDH5416422.1 hypothetical protein [Nitrosopumilus sp.]
MISSENENFIVDEGERYMILMKFTNDYVIEFFIHQDNENMNIIGANVSSEFGTITVMIFGISILRVIYYLRRSSDIILTRIN